MSLIGQLLQLSDEYVRAADVAEVTLSWRMLRDSKKLKALRDGADIQVGRAEDAIRWLSANWPDGAEWPGAIERPASSEAA